MKYFASLFQKKYGIDLLQNQRAKIKMIIEAEKIRKTLSANSDAAINLEYISEDYDLIGIITREEFEGISNDLLNKVEKHCKIAMQNAGIQEVHSVEILGGTSRMPILQRIYAAAFQVPQVHKTLNPEEAISRGCAVQAAMLSPLYKVKDFSIKDVLYYPIFFYLVPLDIDLDEKPEILFDEKSSFPATKILKISKNGPFRIRIMNKICGISTHFIVNSPELNSEYKLKIYITMDKNGVINLEKIERIERLLSAQEIITKNELNPEEIIRDEKKIMDENICEDNKMQDDAKKTDDKLQKNVIQVNFQSEIRGMDENLLTEAIDNEQRYRKMDQAARETFEKKNELESFIYESRANLHSSLKEFVKEENASNILEMLQIAEE